MKKLIEEIKKLLERKLFYKYDFRYDTEDIVARARSINTVALEAGTHLNSLATIIQSNERVPAISDDAASALNKALEEAALAVSSSMVAFQKVIVMAAETEYCSFDIRTGERVR